MTLEEYIDQSKKELDELLSTWLKGNKDDPDNWPLEMDIGEWSEQELAVRFN